MANKDITEINIIADTREKNGWTFSSSKLIKNIEQKKLDTGDYSIVGYETEFAIERKASTSEIATNLTEKRFDDVLGRLTVFTYKYIICEFDFVDLMDFPVNSGMPRYLYDKVKISPNFLISAMSKIQVDYGIPIIYAGNKNNAEIVAESIMKRVLKCR